MLNTEESVRALRPVRRRPGRQHPAGQTRAAGPGRGTTGAGQGRVRQSGRVGQGPDRAEDDHRGRGVGGVAARRHHRRADQRQHRRRAGPGRPATRVPLHFRLPGQGQRGQAERVARLRRRGCRLPDRGRTGGSQLLLLGVRPAGPGDTERLEARPVFEPAEPGQPLRDDRPGDLGRHRRQGHAFRRRRRHRRHHLGHRPLPQGRVRRPGQGHRRRPGRLGVFRRHRAALPGRRRRRGLLAGRLRPDRDRRDHRGLGRRVVRGHPHDWPGRRGCWSAAPAGWRWPPRCGWPSG